MTGSNISFAYCAMKATSDLKVVKVCGVVDPKDVSMIGEMFASVAPASFSLYIGLVLRPASPRAIDIRTAREISKAAKFNGATPVAVFGEECVEEIEAMCEKCDVSVAQLHGLGSRTSFIEKGGEFNLGLDWISVHDVSDDGNIIGEHHEVLKEGNGNGGRCLWTLYDSIPSWRGGRGGPFNWKAFSAHDDPWVLAGGLSPGNVRQAISDLRPNGLDVVGGLCGPDMMRKDAEKVRQFFTEAESAYTEPRI